MIQFRIIILDYDIKKLTWNDENVIATLLIIRGAYENSQTNSIIELKSNTSHENIKHYSITDLSPQSLPPHDQNLKTSLWNFKPVLES